MISEKTFNKSLTISDDLTSNHIELVPIDDTIVATLSSTMKGLLSTMQDVNDKDIPILVAKSTMSTSDSISLHDRVLGDTVDQVSDLVKSHISTTKNVVAPLVIEMGDALNEYIHTNWTNMNVASGFKIIPHKIPRVLVQSNLLNELDYYNNKTLLYPETTPKLSSKSYDDILLLLLTGDSNIDKDIVALSSQMGTGVIEFIYNSLFTITDVNNPLTIGAISEMVVFDRLNYATIIYLISRKLLTDVDNENWDVSLSIYNKVITDMRDYGGTLLFLCLKSVALLTKTQQLVLRKQYATRSIDVNGELYDKWLQSGGSPEVLLGLLISADSKDTSIPAIDAKSDVYKKAWSSFLMFYKTTAENNVFAGFKDFIQGKHNQMLSDLTDLEKGYIESNPKYLQNIRERIAKRIDGIKHKDLDNVNNLALHIVAKDRFYFTSAYHILEDIENATKQANNIDVRQAALLAAINYVTDFAMDQVNITEWS